MARAVAGGSLRPRSSRWLRRNLPAGHSAAKSPRCAQSCSRTHLGAPGRAPCGRVYLITGVADRRSASDHVHGTARTAPSFAVGSRRWDGSHFAVSTSLSDTDVPHGSSAASLMVDGFVDVVPP
jgi:hypothetical protein